MGVARLGVSVIIPTLNEAENIEKLLNKLLLLSENKNYDLEAIIVDDGSTDGTQKLVKNLARRMNVILNVGSYRRGLARSVMEGIKIASHNIVVVMDADLSHPAEKIPLMVKMINEGLADMVVGSRYIKGGIIKNWPWKRKLYSRIAKLLARPLAAVRDPMSGFFAFKKGKLKDYRFSPRGFKIALDLMVRGGFNRIREIPITFQDRISGESKLKGKVIKDYLIQLGALYAFRFGMVNQLPKFLSVGLLGMGIDFMSFILLTRFIISDALTAQMLSFVIAVSHNFTLNKLWTFKAKKSEETSREYFQFFTIALFALGIRTGTIAQCLRYGLHPLLSLLIGIGSATAINFLGSREWIFPKRKRYGGKSSFISSRFVWPSILFLFILRIVYAGIIDLSPEEAYYWNYAMNPAPGYFDHPPMVAWIIRISTIFFGSTEMGVRAGGILLAMGSTYLIYLLGRIWFGEKAGLLAALLFNIIPIYFVYGFIATPDNPLIFFWLLTIYLISIVLQKDKDWGWYLAGISAGLAMFSKYSGAFLLPSAFLFLIMDLRYRKRLLRKEPYLAVLLSFLVFSPVILWNYQNQWASFLFQFNQNINESVSYWGLGFLKFFGGQMGAIFPTFFSVFLLILVISLWLSIKDRSPKWKFSLLFSFPLLAFLTFYSAQSKVKVNWTLPAYLSLLPAVYPSLRYLRFKAGKGLKTISQKTISATFYLLPLLFLLALYHFSICVPFIPAFSKLTGWKELGRAVDREEKALEAETGKHPFLMAMDKYNIASELAFYADGDTYDTFSRNLLGQKALSFDYWQDKKNAQGRDALAIDDEPPDLDLLNKYFARVDREIERIPLIRRGKILRYFYLVRCYNYCG